MSKATSAAPTGAQSELNQSELNQPEVAQPALVRSIRLRVPRRLSKGRSANAPTPLLRDFLAGPENRLLAFVCEDQESLVERGNPLLLVGPSGAGKTALAMTLAGAAAERIAVAADADSDSQGQSESQPASKRRKREEETKSTKPAGEVLALPAIDFARRYSEAVDGDDVLRFRETIDQADVLLLDDVHLMVEKGAAQEELAHRLTVRTEHGRVTILTCRRAPSEIRGFRPILSSRMLPGLMLSVALPETATRRALLAQLAAERELELDADLLDLLERGLPREIPAAKLQAAMLHVALLAGEHDQPIDTRIIQAGIDAATRSQQPSIAEVTQSIAKRFKLRVADLKGPTRKQQVVRARSLAMFLSRQLTDHSLQKIGDFFGGRDHTTVLHACRKIESQWNETADLSRIAAEVTEALQNHR